MRVLRTSLSSQRTTSSSRSLRVRLLSVVKYRFFTSCCEIVLPPTASWRRSMSFCIDPRIASQSTPS